jgi:hypothetical protein
MKTVTQMHFQTVPAVLVERKPTYCSLTLRGSAPGDDEVTAFLPNLSAVAELRDILSEYLDGYLEEDMEEMRHEGLRLVRVA